MRDEFLSWPFFEERHRVLRQKLTGWVAEALPEIAEEEDARSACRGIVKALGAGGWLHHVVGSLDVRSLIIARQLRQEYRDG